MWGGSVRPSDKNGGKRSVGKIVLNENSFNFGGKMVGSV